jgi:CHAT domain-containing protein/Tfp pilus assembly protein PilF
VAAGQRAAAQLIVIAILCWTLAACQRTPSPEADYASALADGRRGKIGEALSTARRGTEKAANRGNTRVYWRLRLLQADLLLMRHDVEGARSLLREPLPESQSAESGAQKRILEGRVMLARSELAGAAKAFDEAAAAATRHGRNDVLIDAELLRGRVRRALGDLQGAERHYRESLRLAASRDDAYQQAVALSNLGTVRLRRSRFDEALVLFRRALEFSERADSLPLTSAILSNIAMCEMRFGEFERAIRAHEQTIEIQQNAGIRLPVVNCLWDIGTIRLFENQPAAALPYFRKAAQLAAEIRAHEYAASNKGEAARALLELGRIEEAERENSEAAAIQAKLPGAPRAPELELNAAEIMCARGQCRDAVRLLGALTRRADVTGPLKWRAHSALAGARAALGARREARAQYEAALALIEEARAGLARTEYKLGFLRHLIRFYRDYVDYLVREGDDARALEIVESSRAQLFAHRMDTGASTVGAASARDLQRRAGRHGAVLLSYWLAPQRSQLWVVSQRGLRRFELPGEAHIAKLVEAYREALEGRLRDPLAGSSESGIELYRTLIEPARRLIDRGARVVIAADGALNNLNFETLIVPGRTPHYWIEDVTVSVTPALRLLDEANPAPPAILAFGDAEPVEEQFPALPSAASELKAIRESFRSGTVEVHSRREATPAAWRRSHPEQFSIIHFAAHALASRESPLDSAIILSRENGDYKLYTRDIAESTLRADLVTVSSCRSAGARAFSGEGLVGFAWAFLHAGARAVIAGMWDVSDRPTSELMTHLYKALAAGERPASALRSAKLALIRAGGNRRKPYNWAAFQLYTRNLPAESSARLKRSST